MNKDSKAKSVSEALVNSFGASPIGYTVGIIILPLSLGWIEKDIITANIFVTLVYASVSFIRVYFLRRVFLRLGYDDNFIVLGSKAIRELYQSFRVLRYKIIKNGCNNVKDFEYGRSV